MKLRTVEPPFGAYTLSQPAEFIRRLASHMPSNRLGRWMVSLLRKTSVGRSAGPVDVANVFPAVHARLYPATNRCEKRAVAGSHIFDPQEREALAQALTGSTSDPFIFVDLGANIGLYSLWMVSVARQAGRGLLGLAVEPDPVTRERLETNLALSSADSITVAACAVGETSGRGAIVTHDGNRGEHRVRTAEINEEDSFEILPIAEICARHGIERIDAMKIDLEGHDEAALRGLFAHGPAKLWPDLIVVEAGKDEEFPPVVQLCLGNGYKLERRTKLNALLARQPNASSRPSSDR
ncbi:methyltransferase, FkbM family [Pannonibacter phragmitetus]|uniref:Methyltransferase, FkbM family n=1 Tax=Pannonibacter phragmitetus TaxID=121719 RepID=A0A378ZQD8_9HYPH|nr:FkbM family methyltransferase [Pannonibacter phragmitetus]SUA99278.1 methyltransferase, FkbM family [Pannonibacter phragmitetus]